MPLDPEEAARDQSQAEIAQEWRDLGQPELAIVFLEICAQQRAKRKAGMIRGAWTEREFSGRSDYDRRHEDGRT